MQTFRLKQKDHFVLFTTKTPDLIRTMRPTRGTGKYDWNINGRRCDMKNPFAGTFNISMNERVQVKMVNDTTMWHTTRTTQNAE